jgi:cytoskeletal protein RodZ
LALSDIAAATKISMTALVAIEQNDFNRLPGGVFRPGYVRTFAAEVGLDGDALAREYRATFETEPPAAPPPRRGVAWPSRLRLAQPLPVVSATIVGIVICGVLLLNREPLSSEDSEGQPAPGLEQVDIAHAVPRADDADGMAAVALATAAVADLQAPSLRLEIRITGLCWVTAEADGERAVYRLMQPGERAQVEAHGAITLRVGNAGAFAYSINGAAGRSLGRSGEAVTVRITDGNLGSLQAEPASPSSPQV